MSDVPRTCAEKRLARIMELGRKLEQVEADRDALLEACKFAKAQITRGSSKKALPILRTAIAKAGRRA